MSRCTILACSAKRKSTGRPTPVPLPRAPQPPAPTLPAVLPQGRPSAAAPVEAVQRGLRRPQANRCGSPLRSSSATVDAAAADPGTGRIWARAPPQPTGLPGGDGAADLSGAVSSAEEKCGILEQPTSPSAVKGLYGGGEKEEPRSSGRSSRKVGREGCPLSKRRRQHSPETSSEESSTARSRYIHSYPCDVKIHMGTSESLKLGSNR
jgi:hypothetical protein